MDLKTLETATWYKKGLPKGATLGETFAYCVCRAVYADLEEKIIEEARARKIKSEAIEWLTDTNGLNQKNATIIRELNILTAPRKKIKSMTKAQLLDIIVKMESLVAGLISSADQDPPDFMKLEEE